jgi:hypothetical protein
VTDVALPAPAPGVGESLELVDAFAHRAMAIAASAAAPNTRRAYATAYRAFAGFLQAGYGEASLRTSRSRRSPPGATTCTPRKSLPAGFQADAKCCASAWGATWLRRVAARARRCCGGPASLAPGRGLDLDAHVAFDAVSCEALAEMLRGLVGRRRALLSRRRRRPGIPSRARRSPHPKQWRTSTT